MDPVERKLGYQFVNKRLLREALSHPSIHADRLRPGQSQLKKKASAQPWRQDNQRLEFLGDSVLQLSLSSWLFRNFGSVDEGTLTKIRANLVASRTLLQIANSLDLGPHLHMGYHEDLAGGRKRESSLTDALEALFGAVYLDSDFQTASEIVVKIYLPLLVDINTDKVNALNPKGQLQELFQNYSPTLPSYTTLEEDGPSHSKTYTVAVQWLGHELAIGKAASKRDAQISAAEEALKLPNLTQLIEQTLAKQVKAPEKRSKNSVKS